MAAAMILAGLTACNSVQAEPPATTASLGATTGATAGATRAAAQQGIASWYALPGRTACGERMNAAAHTAAHRTHPCGTMLRVTNLKNGRVTMVRVNDRGPFVHRRVVDVSRAAGQSLGMIGSGVAPVSVAVVR
jgi:rare lipoprotein A